MLGSTPRHSRLCRLLRWGRLLLLLLLLLIVGSLFYLNTVGLPGFLQNQLETELRTRGINLQFDRVHLRGYRELVANNVRLSQKPEANGPLVLINEAELRLDAAALKRFQVRLQTLAVRGAKLIWPLVLSNSPVHSLSVDDIATEVHFLRNDQWELANMKGRFLNADIHVSGTISNALALRQFFSPRPGPKPGAETQTRFLTMATNLEQIKFSSPAKATVYVRVDGRNANSFQASLKFDAPRAATPWGQWENLHLNVDLSPSQTTGEMTQAEVNLTFGAVESPWGQLKTGKLETSVLSSLANQSLSKAVWRAQLESAQNGSGKAQQISISGTAIPTTNNPSVFTTELSVDMGILQTPWGRSRTNHFASDLVHSLTNLAAVAGSWRLTAEEVESSLGSSEQAVFSGRFAPANATSGGQMPSADWGFWSRLKPFSLDWEGQLNHVVSAKAAIEKLYCVGQWRVPEITIHRWEASLYDGQFQAAATLNVNSRELRSQMSLDFDLHRISPILTTNAQRWLRQFDWETPPHIAAQGRLILPAWTNSQPNWQTEVLPTVEVTGNFEGSPGTFFKVPVSSTRAHFTLTNSFWRVPDLVITRPEGEAHLGYSGDMQTADYHWNIQSQIDPKVLKPLLEQEQQQALDLFKFTAPPVIEGQVWGSWQEPERIGFVARVAVTNFTFRGETCNVLNTTARLTNLFLNFSDLKIRRENQEITAPSAGYDARAGLLFVTNGLSTMDPDLATKVMGPKIRAAIQPYHFMEPPTVVVNGSLPMDGDAKADVHFRVVGKSFNYWRFNVPEISSDIYWRGDHLSISNLQSKFYAGRLAWEGHFDFTDNDNPQFGFRGGVTEADLRLLMGDMTHTNNHLEGILNGNLIITSANASDWQSWTGFGDARLRDGFLWDIPIFGVFSPVLEKIVPGLGKSRASAGSATFSIRNSVIHTADLEVRSPAFGLQYEGTVDFNGNVNARMQAEPFRDAWGVGRVVSLALRPLTKVFEYKVTGTLNDPKSEPLYIPKMLLWPFQPFRTIKQIFSLEERNSSVSPPAAPREP